MRVAAPADAQYARALRRSLARLRVPAPTALAFLAAASWVLLYALRGGSYDLVVRHEMALAIWWLLALGFASGTLPRAAPSRLLGIPAAGFAVLVVVTGVALTFTESDERTVNELARVLHHGGLLVAVVALLDRRTVAAAVAGVATGGALACLLALGSRLVPGLFPADTVNEVFRGTRLNYPLGYWNAVAALAAMVSVLTLGLSAHARTRFQRALSLAPVPAVIGTAYLTYSRGGVVAICVGLVALIALVPNRGLTLLHALVALGGGAAVIAAIRAHPEIARGEGSAGALLVAVAALVSALVCGAAAAATHGARLDRKLRMPSRVARRMVALCGLSVLVLAAEFGPDLVARTSEAIRTPTHATRSADPAQRFEHLNSARYNVWSASLDIHASDPFRGTGPGTFEFAWNRNERYDHFVRDAHSLYLEMLAEAGWPGLIGVALLLGGVVAAGLWLRIQRRHDATEAGLIAITSAVVVVFVAYAGYDWMWEATAVSAFALIVAGCVLVAGSRTPAAPSRALRAGLAVAALAAALTQMPGLVATSKIRSSQASMVAGRISEAAADAEDAVSSEPWAASPYVQRALVNEQLGRLDDARADIELAQRREPTNYRHPLLLARIQARRGQVQAALSAFERARRLAPGKGPIVGGAVLSDTPTGAP